MVRESRVHASKLKMSTSVHRGPIDSAPIRENVCKSTFGTEFAVALQPAALVVLIEARVAWSEP
jgi:hypothetical protein